MSNIQRPRGFTDYSGCILLAFFFLLIGIQSAFAAPAISVGSVFQSEVDLGIPNGFRDACVVITSSTAIISVTIDVTAAGFKDISTANRPNLLRASTVRLNSTGVLVCWSPERDYRAGRLGIISLVRPGNRTTRLTIFTSAISANQPMASPTPTVTPTATATFTALSTRTATATPTRTMI